MSDAREDRGVAKGRLDALTDGVFAFAMTLLVINIDLPEDFHPTSGAELVAGLARLADTFFSYIITFVVLAMFWLARAQFKEEPEAASTTYAWMVILHLFFVTFLPFSMVLIGRYDLLPATIIYAANLILLALTAIGISLVVYGDTGRREAPSGLIEYGVLIVSALLSMAIGLFAPENAAYAYLLNFAAPLVRKWVDRR
jgi:uncharacterized membrane protein